MTRTCSMSHMGSIHMSALGVDTCTYLHYGQKQFQETSCVPAIGWHAPGLENVLKRAV